MKPKKRNNPLKNVLLFAIILVVVTGVYAGGYFLYTSLQPKVASPGSNNQNANPDAPDAAIEATDETVVAPNTIDSYTVAADMPRFLRISSLGLKARIQQMTINSNGAVQAPVNIYDSGWYKGSAKPGTQGAAFIDGHASGSTRQGLFAYIDTLKPGDTMSVEQGDGTVFTYRVVQSETVPKDTVDMNKVLAVYGGAKEGLNLMTCTGKWIESEKTYTDRVVVYTERVL